MLARLFWASLYTVQPAECSYLQRYQECVSRKPSQNLVILAPLKLSCVERGYNKELDGWPAANILSREPLLLFFLFFLFFFLFGPIFILKCAFCKAYLSLIRPLDEKDKQTNKQTNKINTPLLASSTLVQRAKYEAETSLWSNGGESAKLIAGLPRCNMNSMADVREEVYCWWILVFYSLNKAASYFFQKLTR